MILTEAVYIACAAASLLCALLLLRGYLRERSRLLFWSSVCFFGLTLNNALLFVDIIILPQIDLFLWRTLLAVLGFAALLYGLIWEDL